MQKILIIDDDSRLVKKVATYLKEFSYRIDSALNRAATSA
jgi:DNA-binding response OmpR family regulator